MQPHERAVHGLLEAIDHEELARCPESRREGAGLALMRESLRQRLQRQLAQALSLVHQPRLERLLVDTESIEEVAAIKKRSFRQRLRRLAGEPGECRDVELDRGGIERHRFALGPKGA